MFYTLVKIYENKDSGVTSGFGLDRGGIDVIVELLRPLNGINAKVNVSAKQLLLHPDLFYYATTRTYLETTIQQPIQLLIYISLALVVIFSNANLNSWNFIGDPLKNANLYNRYGTLVFACARNLFW